ncbi:MAG: hypothetical protein J6S69_03965, partial [Proteobacteria bacterium]|nr:hypothetical protein [Pseudomonadota bacterium]
DLNDVADEESAPFCRAKKAPLESRNQEGRRVNDLYFLQFFAVFLPQNGCNFEKATRERRERAGARDRLERCC